MAGQPIRVRPPPPGPTKTGAEGLVGLPRFQLAGSNVTSLPQRGLYSFSEQGFQFDFLYMPSKERRLFVLLSGYADRSKVSAPVFQRWSWANSFPGHCIFIADPSLHFDSKLGLGWYVGTRSSSIVAIMARLVRNVACVLEVPSANVFAYASSAGAFAAMQLSLKLPDLTCISINPQIDVLRYNNPQVDRFLSVCLGIRDRAEARNAFESRLSLMGAVPTLATRRIVYAQNVLDHHHLEHHFSPFMTALRASPCRPLMDVVLFEEGGGHASAEPRALFPELLRRAIAIAGC